MLRRFPLALLLLAGGAAAAADGPAAKTADVFGLTKVWSIHLEISAKDWDAMQPAGGPRFGFPGPGGPGQPPRPGGPDAPQGDSRVSAFGMEFPYVRGTFTAGGQTLKDVGLRFKGNSSYLMASRGLKRPFKIDFNRHNDAQTFHGLKALNLNNNAMDPTQLREALSYAVFNAAGVPAPRTAFAEVTLTVPGKYDREYLGLYTVIEEVDKTFLKDRFKSSKGLLLKPERVGPLQYLGEDWSSYQDRYNPKTDVSKKHTRRVIDFVRLVNRGSDEQFRKEIGDHLDVDQFLRFLAANALLCNLDSFLTLGHNYYLYLHPETNKIAFVPWDLNHSLGGFVMIGTPDQLADLSVGHPHSGQNRLIDRLLAIDDVRKSYEDHLRRLTKTCFAAETLHKDIDAAEKAVKEIVAKEAKAAAARKEGQGFGMPPMFGQAPSLKTFVSKRGESVAAQLAGKSKGYVPAMRFGPPGGPGRPGGFGPGNLLAKPILEAADGDKNGKLNRDELVAVARRFFKECDKEKKEAIDQKALAEGIDRIFPRPPGFPGGPPPGGPRPGGAPPGGPGPGAAPPGGPGPGGQPPPGRPGVVMFPGPGAMLAGSILKRADADKDGKLTVEELAAAAEVLFKESDKDKSGALEEKEITEAINQLFPPPPGFGPPGQPPGREPPRDRPPQEGRP